MAPAQVPDGSSYQGLLLDPTGAPLNDPGVVISARIWNDPVSAVPADLIYQETHVGVEVIDGVFAIALGAGSSPIGAFDASTFGSPSRWLEIEVDGETLSPRQPFYSVAYAFQAEQCVDALTLGGRTAQDIEDAILSGLDFGDLAGQASDAQIPSAITRDAEVLPLVSGALGFTDITGTAADAQIPATVARDSEVFGLVLSNDGGGSGLDADRLDALSSASFLRADVSDNFTGLTLTVVSGSTLFVDGTLALGANDRILWGVENLGFDSGESRFEASDDLAIVGALDAGHGFGAPIAYHRLSNSAFDLPDSGQITNTDDLFVGDDLELDGQIFLNRFLYMQGDATPPELDQTIYFADGGTRVGEFLRWDDSEDRFQVSDDLQADNFRYTLGHEKYFNIPASGFIPELDFQDEEWFTTSGYGFVQSGAGALGIELTASVHIQDWSAQITGLACYARDSNVLEDVSYTATLRRRQLFADAATSMAQVSLTTSAFPGTVQQSSTSLITDPVVSNINYFYDITISWSPGAAGSSLRFYGCRVTYRVDEL